MREIFAMMKYKICLNKFWTYKQNNGILNYNINNNNKSMITLMNNLFLDRINW